MTNLLQQRYKIALIGEINAGKTTLSHYINSDNFIASSASTVGAAYHAISYNNKTLELWDTSGQEKFATLTTLYYRNAAIMLLVFDASNNRFENKLRFYLDEIKFKVNEGNNYNIIIVCNKIDLVDKAKLGELKKQVTKIIETTNSKDNTIEYIEVSSKNKIGRDMLLRRINEMTEDIHDKKVQTENEYSLNDNIIDSEKLKKLEKSHSGGCCF